MVRDKAGSRPDDRHREFHGGHPDEQTITLLHDLQVSLRPVEPPSRLWDIGWSERDVVVRSQGAAKPLSMPAHVRSSLDNIAHLAGPPAPDHSPTPRRWRLYSMLAAIATIVALVMASMNAIANPRVSDETSLGKVTNSVPPANPVGEFHSVRPIVTTNGLPTLVFLGTQTDERSAAETWPLVKALQQFGTLTDIAPTTTLECANKSTLPGGLKLWCQDQSRFPGPATFDLSHLRFASNNLTIRYVDFIQRDRQLMRSVPQEVRRLFDAYVRPPGVTKWSDAVWHAALGDNIPLAGATHLFPLVAIGGYGATGTNVAIPGDFTVPATGLAVPFTVVQRSLQSGKATGGASVRPPASLVQDVNAEANVITAFICHADGRRPASACNRPIIRSLLKRIK